MKGSSFSNSLLQLIFNNVALANIGNAGGLQPSGVPGNLYVSLHTADPGAGGNQSTNEANYTGYLNRPAVVRSGAGWNVFGASVANAGTVLFPICTAGTNTITFFGVGTAQTGAGLLMYSGPLITTYYDFTSESANTLVVPGHALSINDPVQAITMPNGTLPTGLASGTTYYVLTVVGDSITLSATVGGAVLVLTTPGAGAIGKINPLPVSVGITPTFAVGTLIPAVEY